MADLLGPNGEPLVTPQEEAISLREQLYDADQARRMAERSAEYFAWHVLNLYADDEDIPHRDRIKLVKLARDVWKRDPQAGRAVNLLNDFVFGRGAGKPKARDQLVQEVLDEAWNDAQNQRVLTSYAAQRALGTDLAIQSNVYLLLFDQGEDGKVKLGRLNHDSVDAVVRDPENRDRVLYYKASEHRVEWDYQNDKPKTPDGGKPKVRYYEHWANVQEAEESGDQVDKPPKEKRGEGRVYQIAVNRTSEMAFGHPEFHRVTRWFSAFNELMSSRVDVQKAASSFLMKRRVKAGPQTAARLAAQELSRRGELGSAAAFDSPPEAPKAPPRTGSILTETDSVSHEPFTLRPPDAEADGNMLLGQVAAGVGWPRGYIGGDPGPLAGSTTLELPTLKLVEGRQEAFESAFRWFCDRVIERAVETGRIPEDVGPEELQEQLDRQLQEAALDARRFGWSTEWLEAETKRLREAHEDKATDEELTKRDLGYEFALPSALKRTLGDFTTAIANAAKTFDPNGTNIELSRLFLGIFLSEGLEVEDAARAVERIFPEGYVDPAIAAFQAASAGRGAPGAPVGGELGGGEEGSTGQDGRQHPASNAYGAPQRTPPPEQRPASRMQQALSIAEALEEGGMPRDVAEDIARVAVTRRGLVEAIGDLGPADEHLVLRREGEDEDLFTRDVESIAERELRRAEERAVASTNGNH